MGTCMPQPLSVSTVLWRHLMLRSEMKLEGSTQGGRVELNTINKINI